ncbi:MAG: YdaU family protein [Pseudomonadota bacterium]|nr:YdaU family protein [Pseudomonadota bacterium]
MSRAEHWYKRYPKDFIMGTMGMSLELKGAYSLLVDLMHDHGGPIADDPRYLSGIMGVSLRKWASIREELIAAGKIICREGQIIDTQAMQEIQNALEASQRHIENGRLGGISRVEKSAKPQRNLNETSTKPEEKSSENDNKPSKIKASVQARLEPGSSILEENRRDKKGITDVIPPHSPPREKHLLPEWIPPDDWEAFLEMRKIQKKPPTERAKALLARQLERLVAEGHSPSEVLQQSTVNNWTDLWPVKGKNNVSSSASPGTTGRPDNGGTADDRLRNRVNATARLIDDLCGNADQAGSAKGL